MFDYILFLHHFYTIFLKIIRNNKEIYDFAK